MRGLRRRVAIVALAGSCVLATYPVTAPGSAADTAPGLAGDVHGFDMLVEAGVYPEAPIGPDAGRRLLGDMGALPLLAPVTPTPARGVRTAPYRMFPFTIRALPTGSRPYDDVPAPSLAYHPVYHDAAGVPMQMIEGRLVYKPAGLAQLSVAYLNGYTYGYGPGRHFGEYGRTRDPAYLQRARDIADVFRRIGVRSGDATFLPYDFTFAMHRNPADLIRAPWYSAMAQGLALSLFVRLYEIDRDPADLEMAQRLYRSLAHVGRGSSPWVTWIDARRYLWLEEYAQPEPEHTLNGFLFAVFGLYDYYVATRHPSVLNTLRGSLTTLKAHVSQYRNVGGPSDYCLKHGKPQVKYHRIVISQLLVVAAFTGDDYYASVARAFYRDTP